MTTVGGFPLSTMSYKHYILSLLYINVLLSFVTNSTASPVITATTPSSNTTDGIQSVETTQSFTSDGGTTIQICTIIGTPTTLSDGESAVVITQNCSSTFIPSANSSAIPVKPSIISHTLDSSTTVTLPTSATPNLPSSSSTVANASSFPASVAFFTPVATPSLTQSTISTPISTTSSPSSNASVSTVNSGGAHLSSLPIFLGVFGGVAGSALIIIGCMVYKPFKHLNNMRLNPPACMRRMRRRETYRDSNFSFHCVPEKHVDSPGTYTAKTKSSGSY